jgi:3-oxoadipate enol-lactonase
MTTPFADVGSIELSWGRLSYRRQPGGGRPIVLLHPLALASQVWELAVGELANERSAIAVDLRGHGESDWDGRPFAIADLAEDVIRLLQALNTPQCDVIGMSMGGCVAMTIAAARPNMVNRLVLCDTTAWYGPEAPATWEKRALDAEQKPRHELLPFQVKRWFNEGFAERQPTVVQQVVDIFLRTPGRLHAQACRSLGAFDGRPLLGSIEAKTLVVTGEEDYATPPSMGRSLAEAVPGAVFSLWPGVRHFAVIESGELRRFIVKHLTSSTKAGRQ